MHEHLVDQVDLLADHVHAPDVDAEDLEEAGHRYEGWLVELGGVDVQLLGIGSDGHVGFNEPGSSLRSRTRIKTLTAATRADNARFFADLDVYPILFQCSGTRPSPVSRFARSRPKTRLTVRPSRRRDSAYVRHRARVRESLRRHPQHFLACPR